MRYIFFILSLYFCSASIHAQLLDVRLLSNYNTRSVQITTQEGVYETAGTETQFKIAKAENFVITAKSGKVSLSKNGQVLQSADTILIQTNSLKSFFKIQMLDKKIKTRLYQGNLLITHKNGYLKIINSIDLQRYLAGVIETEGGGNKHVEFYKVQAILSRTYALGHRNRHQKEGYNLCDDVHCQAYKNKLRFTPDITQAISDTDDLIMVDANNKIIDGFFSANCGGQTSETDWIWNEKLPYLPTVKDTFCTHTWQANWTKKIGQWEWKKYLTDKYAFPVNHPEYGKYLYHFDQKERKIFYGDPALGIPLHELRSHFRLKSTFFSVAPEGDYVLITGRGFGHGIGMCQEGAMNMAKKGFAFQSIIQFYFRPTEIIHYEEYILRKGF